MTVTEPWVCCGAAIILGTTLALLSAHPAMASRAEEDAQLRAAQAFNSFDRSVDIERRAISASNGRAVRQGDVLTLRTGARSLALKDKPCDLPSGDTNTDCRDHYLYADLPSRHAYVVLVGHYEGFDVRLIDDRTGRTTEIEQVPWFSADSKEFVTINNDLENDVHCRFQIWHLEREPTSEWCGNPDGLPAIAEGFIVDWTLPNRIGLRFETHVTDNLPVVWRGALVRKGKGWRLETQVPAAAHALGF